MKFPFFSRDKDAAKDDAATDAAELPESTETKPVAVAEARRGGGPATLSLTLRDLLVVTWAVPAERIRPHVPEKLPLDLLPGPEGERIAFVQTLCAYYESARWSPLPERVGSSYHQVSHRVLTRREKKRGTFVLRTYVSTSEAHGTQRSATRDADYARFSLHIDGDPARGTYRSYTVRCVGDLGQANLEVRALPETPETPPAPFGKWADMVDFLTDRPENYFRASTPKTGIGLLPVEQGRITEPRHAEVVSAKQTLWTETNILSSEELLKPLSVLMVAAVPLSSYPPRYARLG